LTKKFRLFCAIDLGQSNTRWVVSSESEEITEGVTGKGIINVLLPNGREVLRGNLESVREATNMFDFQVVSIAATGIEKERAEYSVAIEIAEKVFRGKRVILNSDIVAFHLANFDRGPGIILHAGSGTFAYGTDGLGNSVKVGGWGYLLGDIGGGYWTGLKGVQEAVKSLDGLNKSERLAQEFYNYLGVRTKNEIKPAVYNESFSAREISGFCKVVFSLAKEGDPVCREIIREGAMALAEMVIPVIVKLNISEPTLCLAGKLLEEEGVYRNQVVESLHKIFGKDISYFVRTHTALYGAKIVALGELEGKE